MCVCAWPCHLMCRFAGRTGELSWHTILWVSLKLLAISVCGMYLVKGYVLPECVRPRSMALGEAAATHATSQIQALMCASTRTHTHKYIRTVKWNAQKALGEAAPTCTASHTQEMMHTHTHTDTRAHAHITLQVHAHKMV